MNTLFLDLETFSTVPITHGTHRYAEVAEVLLIPHAWNDEPAVTWDATEEGCDPRAMLISLIDQADEVVIHNSHFDRTVMRWQGVDLPIEKVHDTMVRAMMHSLPGALGQLCDILGVATDKAKDKDGKRLIHLFTKPLGKNRKLDRATRETHPEEWERFKEYARLDVEAMREVYKLLPRWNYTQSEVELWRLDQKINDRGVAIDLDLAHAALRAAKRAGESLAAKAKALTDGAVPSATQRNVLLEHLANEHNFTPDDLKKGTVAALLKEELPDGVRELLEVRQQAAATSPAKYKVLINATSTDGRLRGTLQFCGASRTGRWGGRLFQPQNLPRPTLKQSAIELGIEAMKADAEDLLFENPMELCSSAVRGCIVAPEGRRLVIADLSNIEGRVLAWLAGETWKINAFRDFDAGIGPDLYVLAYSRSFNLPVEAVLENKKTGDGSMRQIGKVQELSLGYGGSIGAFTSMGSLYGVALPDEDGVLAIVKAWRQAHPAVTRFWYDTEKACRAAIANEGHVFRVRDISVRRDGVWLRIRRPSGVYLSYPLPEVGRPPCKHCDGNGFVLVGGFVEDGGTPASKKVCEHCGGEGLEPGTRDNITYMGNSQYTRKWERLETYYGRLVENLVQSVARDVFASGMVRAEADGYEIGLHVHDELITETPDSPEYNAEHLAALMSKNPSWAHGLPLAAAGFETYRYRKD